MGVNTILVGGWGQAASRRKPGEAAVMCGRHSERANVVLQSNGSAESIA